MEKNAAFDKNVFCKQSKSHSLTSILLYLTMNLSLRKSLMNEFFAIALDDRLNKIPLKKIIKIKVILLERDIHSIQAYSSERQLVKINNKKRA